VSFGRDRSITICPWWDGPVDLGEQHATWFSLAGDEIVRLDQPTARPEPLIPQ
jgi:hypothetical protein